MYNFTLQRRNCGEMFSIIGIKLAVEEFYKMGCRKVTVFLPPNRQGNKGSPKIPDRERWLQRLMEKEGVIKVCILRISNIVFLWVLILYSVHSWSNDK